MKKFLLILFLACSGCYNSPKFHYGDVVSWKKSPNADFEFYNCSEKLGTITKYRESLHSNTYFVDTGNDIMECSFSTNEDNLKKEGISKL